MSPKRGQLMLIILVDLVLADLAVLVASNDVGCL